VSLWQSSPRPTFRPTPPPALLPPTFVPPQRAPRLQASQLGSLRRGRMETSIRAQLSRRRRRRGWNYEDLPGCRRSRQGMEERGRLEGEVPPVSSQGVHHRVDETTADPFLHSRSRLQPHGPLALAVPPPRPSTRPRPLVCALLPSPGTPAHQIRGPSMLSASLVYGICSRR
jgi:hypothetical protein